MTDTQTLLSIVEGLGRPKVVIIGDPSSTDTSRARSRISPEAPIPVLAVRSSESASEGPATWPRTSWPWTSREVVGIVGDDGHGRDLRRSRGE